jgi:heterotetrameric sarcosine oxidase gamma subunit
MPKPAEPRALELNAAFEVCGVSARTIAIVKCWASATESGFSSLVLPRELPSHVGEVRSGAVRALCTAPGEWLVVSPGSSDRQTQESLGWAGVNGLTFVDVSAGLVALECRGLRARDVLSKGCGLDLDLAHFPPDRCARTRFAQIPVIVDCMPDPSQFQLYAARSYGRHLETWLRDAAVEFLGWA